MGALETLQDKYGFTDEEAEQLRDDLSPAQLRQHVKKLEKEAQKVPSLEDKVQKFENRPLIEKAFKDAGLDWSKVDEMPPFVRQQIEGFAEFSDTEKLSAFMKDNRLPVTQQGQQQPGQQGQPQSPEQGQTAPAQQIVNQAMESAQQAPPGYDAAQAIREASPEDLPGLLEQHGVHIAGND